MKNCNNIYSGFFLLPKAGTFMCKSIDDYYRIKCLVKQGIKKEEAIKLIN